ncbi:MAG TPA: methyltransferase domain-containing protein [Actinomycetota bacterium]
MGVGWTGAVLSKLRAADARVFDPMRDHYGRLLGRILSGCGSVLDVGCGSDSPLGRLEGRKGHRVGVDIHEGDLQASRRAGIHEAYAVLDVTLLRSAFRPRSFDCVLASDLIEHLEKDAGYELISAMEELARRRVVVFTPNGFLEQPPDPDNPWQEHVSGWTVEELEGLGYRVLGVNGWRPLRTMYAEVRFRPLPLWERLSVLTQPLTEGRPRRAFQLLAMKDLA